MNLNSALRRRATAGLALALAASLLLAGCRGYVTAPTDITDTTAVLHAQTECVANTQDNPCTGWFQYWADGSTTILTTPQVPANVDTGGLIDFQQTVTGLTPDTVYHYQFCGYGDDNIAQPGLCVGPRAVTSPGSQPDPANFSATQNFRTASADTTATVDLGRVLSSADTDANPISRDGGLSAPYSDTEAIWIFGDTGQQNGPAFLALGTAAAGPFQAGAAPQSLHELPRPPAAPEPNRPHPANFFPAPEGLLKPGDPPVPCIPDNSSYAADWLSGAARIPGTNRVLLSWVEICVTTDGSGWPVERVRIADYDPATNQFVQIATPFVADPLQDGLPGTKRVANPVFGDDGYLYFFGSRRDPDSIFVSRVSADPAAWSDPANYRWWGQPGAGPAQWTSDDTSAISVLSGVVPWGIHVADFSGVGGGKKLAMLVKDSYFNTTHFRIYTADSPLGPWTAGPVGRLPNPDTCPGTFGCYAFHAHPELSTADTFVFSWYASGDTGGKGGGHVRLGAIAW